MYRQTSLVLENTKQVKVSTSDMYQVYHRTVQIHHGTSFDCLINNPLMMIVELIDYFGTHTEVRVNLMCECQIVLAVSICKIKE